MDLGVQLYIHVLVFSLAVPVSPKARAPSSASVFYLLVSSSSAIMMNRLIAPTLRVAQPALGQRTFASLSGTAGEALTKVS